MPGLLLGQRGRKFASLAMSGSAPLGELVQWSDVIASLYVLGHRVILSVDLPEAVK